MRITQARSHKSETTPKTTNGRGVRGTAGDGDGGPETRPGAAAGISAEDRNKLIARLAYFRAEKRAFAPGCELEDWLEAEAEVARTIGAA